MIVAALALPIWGGCATRSVNTTWRRAERACLRGSVEKCAVAGQGYEHGYPGFKKDKGIAAQRYAKGCTPPTHTLACDRLDLLTRYYSSTHPRFERTAVVLVRHACKAGYAPSCAQLGRWYLRRSNGRAADRARGRVLLAKACRAAADVTAKTSAYTLEQLAQACATLSTIFMAKSRRAHTRQDRIVAAKLSILATEIGLEAQDARWAERDRMALTFKRARERAAALNRKAFEAALRKARQPSTFDKVIHGILGWMSVGVAAASVVYNQTRAMRTRYRRPTAHRHRTRFTRRHARYHVSTRRGRTRLSRRIVHPPSYRRPTIYQPRRIAAWRPGVRRPALRTTTDQTRPLARPLARAARRKACRFVERECLSNIKVTVGTVCGPNGYMVRYRNRCPYAIAVTTCFARRSGKANCGAQHIEPGAMSDTGAWTCHPCPQGRRYALSAIPSAMQGHCGHAMHVRAAAVQCSGAGAVAGQPRSPAASGSASKTRSCLGRWVWRHGKRMCAIDQRDDTKRIPAKRGCPGRWVRRNGKLMCAINQGGDTRGHGH